MGLDDAAGNGETKARAAVVATRWRAAPAGIEDPWQARLRDPTAAVDHCHQDVAILGAAGLLVVARLVRCLQEAALPAPRTERPLSASGV